MSDMVKIEIDGREIEAPKGENLLKVARANGINIPGLCYYDKVSITGDCRLCLVKIAGRWGMVPSCVIPIEDGMKVTAFDAEIEATRKVVLEMLLSEHNDDCITCDKDGDCMLQDLAFRYELDTEKRSLPAIWKGIHQHRDLTSPVLNYDSAKCVKCERCAKACAEIQGKGVLSMGHRAIHSMVVAGNEEWSGSECDGCGECVQACPVGALVEKPVYGERVRKKDADKRVMSVCPYCGVGCRLELWVKNNRIVKVKGVNAYPNHGSTCVKGRFGLDFVNSPLRLKKPLMRRNRNEELREVEWDEALQFTAQRFAEIKAKHGSAAMAGLASARVTNEDNFLFQKFIRTQFNTNSVDHCARL